MSRYDENPNETYEDRLLQYNDRRARSSAEDLKRIHNPEFTRRFLQYAEDDDEDETVGRGIADSIYKNKETRLALHSKASSLAVSEKNIPRQLTHGEDGKKIQVWTQARLGALCTWFLQCIPSAIRCRKDIRDLFSSKGIISIIEESRQVALEKIKQIYETRNWGTGDTKYEDAVRRVHRPADNIVSLLNDVQSALVEKLSMPGSYPDVKGSREDVVLELSERRVHDALFSDRVKQVEIMLHATNVPERFTFGNIVDNAKNRRCGTTERQRVAIQRVWDTPGLRQLAKRRGRADENIDACYRF